MKIDVINSNMIVGYYHIISHFLHKVGNTFSYEMYQNSDELFDKIDGVLADELVSANIPEELKERARELGWI